jgi:hypothetical protein
MGIVQLPGVKGRGEGERAALRRGLATGIRVHLVPVRPKRLAGAPAYCAGCAGRAVARGAHAYCSIECSLGGDDTA